MRLSAMASGVQFVAIRRLFEEHEFRNRGLFSVRDLTELISEWRRPDGAIHFVNGHQVPARLFDNGSKPKHLARRESDVL